MSPDQPPSPVGNRAQERDRASLLRRLLSNRLAGIGIFLISLLSIAALTAPLLSHVGWLADPSAQSSSRLDSDGMPLPVGGQALLGTDNLGRDVLSRVVYGARISLTVGLIGITISFALGGLINLTMTVQVLRAAL